MSEPQIARFVHLLGGLRAFDVLASEVDLGVDGLQPIAQFKRPPYAELYRTLNSFNAQVIGAEFIEGKEDTLEFSPRDWLIAKPEGGWAIKPVQQEWSNIKHQASQNGEVELASIAERIRTYLRLIELRIRKISDAYHQTLRGQLTPKVTREAPRLGMFGNLWLIEIDAAIHAFLSDAGTLRDVLAEACWVILLGREDKSVTTMASLMKRAKQAECGVTAATISDAQNGWIKSLTDIRNHLIHVAPVSSFHEHTFCDIRELELRGGVKMMYVHYPFTESDWTLRRNVTREVDYSKREEIVDSINNYNEFSKKSGDALEYCWRTASRLAKLAEDIRLAGNLTAPLPTVKPTPGTLKIYRPLPEEG